MATSGGDKSSQSFFSKILELQEWMKATRENVQKLMQDSDREGTADDVKVAARNANKKLEEFDERFYEFENDLVSQLEPYQKRYQELRKEIDTIDHIVSGNLLALEVIQEPTVAEAVAEEQEQSPHPLKSKELQAPRDATSQTTVGNLVARILLQEEIQTMGKSDGKKIHKEKQPSKDGKPPLPPKNPTPKQRPAAAPRIEQKEITEEHHLTIPGIDRTLCDVIMEMYGFAREESHKIELQFEMEMDQKADQGTVSSTRTRILNWDAVWKVKVMLGSSKSKSQRVQNLIPGMLKVWIFLVENQLYNLVLYLRSITAVCEAAVERFQRLRASLVILRERNNAMVPIVVQRILALLKMEAPVGQSELNRDQQVALYEILGFEEVIVSIHRMILQLTSVLNPKNATPNVHETCEEVLREAEVVLDGIERRIMDGKKNVREKKKRDDEDGVMEGRENVQDKWKKEDEDGGNEGGSSKM